MSFSKLLEKIFKNSGAGPSLSDDVTTELVHKSGNEEISGVKELGNVTLKKFDLVKGTIPSTKMWSGFYFVDNTADFNDWFEDKRFGWIESTLYSDGGCAVNICSCKNEANSTDFASLIVGIDPSGVPFASCPSTPTSSSNPNAILTRDWIPKDTRIVHRTSNEEISGRKAFQQDLYLVNPSMEKGTVPSQNIWNSFIFADYGGTDATLAKNMMGFIQIGYQSNGSSVMRLSVLKNAANNNDGISLEIYYESTNVFFRPTATNLCCLGSSNWRWKDIYVNTATLTGSDERIKTAIDSIPDDALDAWSKVDFKQYKMVDSVKEKGLDLSRIHVGLIAQNVDNAFKSENLDASNYGLFCYDEWNAEPEERDEEGNIIKKAQPAGSMYSLRYEEALCMEAAYMRRKVSRLESRIAELEKANSTAV